MTAAEHFRAAEQYLVAATEAIPRRVRAEYLAFAQVHATLALAAAATS